MTAAHASLSIDDGMVRYATFTRRARAVLIDATVLYSALVVIAFLADLARDVPGSGRLAWLALLCICVLYEPLLVSLRGATIGHAAKGLVIVDDDTGRPPSFARALLRYFGKLPLGVFGFVTTMSSPRYQAAHDLLTHTTVQLSPNADSDVQDFHFARDDTPVEMPSRARRAVVVVGYVVLSYVVFGRIVGALVSSTCLHDGACSDADSAFWRGMFTLWLILCAEVVLAGWRGMLPGARATVPTSPPPSRSDGQAGRAR